MHNRFQSPFSSRYASEKMQRLFSDDVRYSTWRRLWLSLAKAEKALGLEISWEQIEALSEHTEDIDYDCVKAREAQVRHDVMVHIYAYGKAAPEAAGIIHLGATSGFVTDNADLIIYRDALLLIRAQLLSVCRALAEFADRYNALPTLGYTHYQPAQLVTVGKRACLWLSDFVSDIDELDYVLSCMKLRGVRGTTGTEASFMELFEGDEKKIAEMNRLIAGDFGFDSCFDICAQTYPRKLDSRIMNVLSSIAQSCCKMANDIRLLQHDRHLEEPFEEDQIGSSAMAYKRNPMRCERICSLSRYLMSEALNAPLTASVQWLERTLDDSANRRVSIPEAFLCCDGILRLADNVVSGLKVNEKMIEADVRRYLPFIATENILMEAVKKGADRQKAHELIRKCSMEATVEVRDGGKCRLLEQLADKAELGLDAEEIQSLAEPSLYTGRCEQQVSDYLQKLVTLLSSAAKEENKIEI